MTSEMNAESAVDLLQLFEIQQEYEVWLGG